MRVLTAAEMRAAEAAAVAAGTSYEALMENAGEAAARAIEVLAGATGISDAAGTGSADGFGSAPGLGSTADSGSAASLGPAAGPGSAAGFGSAAGPGSASGLGSAAGPGSAAGLGPAAGPAPASGPGLAAGSALTGAAGFSDDARPPAAARSMVLLCGRGNNAGDAFVVARLLAAKGWRCTLWLLCGRNFSDLAQLNLARVPGGVAVAEGDSAPPALATAGVLVDGVFGTGFKTGGKGGGLPENVVAALRLANAAPGLRVALDIPSGLDCDTGAAAPDTFRAGHTLTFGAYKPALVMPKAAAYTGRVECLDIGL